MATFVAKTMITDQIKTMKGEITGTSNKNKINWDDFNYPPFLKVIHYDVSEVDPEHRLIVRSLWLSHILIFVYSIVNIINNISITIGTQNYGIRILYSFMFFFSFNPIQGFLFYRGYKGVASDAFLLALYKWVQIVMILCWTIFAIIDWLGFNGFIVVPKLFKAGLPFEGVLAIIEDSCLILTALLSTFALVKVWSIPTD
ncbi:hypothetical protein pb186bvf_011004 [Paramecium bursaria]